MAKRDEKRTLPPRPEGGTADDECVTNPPAKEKHQRYSRYAGEPHEDVDAMSEDSFPASDPPSYSGSTAGTGNNKRSPT